MAYLKIKRFREAEDDCTEALNLDDRYIKAYSLRATARKELAKFEESLEDAEFALRMEPDNQEVKKQFADAKSLYEKENIRKVPMKNSTHMEEVKMDNSRVRSVTDIKKNSKDITGASLRSNGNNKQALKPSEQELATRASSRAMDEAARNISQPTTAYQFEVSWHGFRGDRTLQSRFLKVTSPSSLPQIFKNALIAPPLVDIVKCVGAFFRSDPVMERSIL